MNLNTQIQELEKRISAQGRRASQIETSIEATNSSLSEIQTKLSNSNASYIFNTSLKQSIHVGSRSMMGAHARLVLRCEKGCRVRGTMTAKLVDVPTTTVINASLYLNGTFVRTIEETGSFEGNVDLVVDLDFMPKDVTNFIELKFGTAINDLIIASLELDLTGLNLMILNRDPRFHFWAYNSVYYISFTELNRGFYLEQAKADFDLTAERTEFPYSTTNNGEAIHWKYYRRVAFVTDHYNLLMMREQVLVEYENFQFTTNRFGMPVASFKVYGEGAFDGHLYFRSSYQTYCICYTKDDFSIVMGNYTLLDAGQEPEPTLNGTPLEHKYVQCIPVYDFFLASKSVNGFIGFILLDKEGKLWYLPEHDSTYMLEIGMGTQPNAYMQADDLTINVYYRFENDVIKKVLKRADRQSPFVLQDGETVFENTEEYIELDGTGSIRRINDELVVFDS